jgi:large exoprotein involved in heme utilization and adhesion
MVYLKESEITASVGGGAGTVGGNISIDPQFVILDHSKIIANAFEGRGGNIRIVAGVFLSDPYSIVDASSALGIDGNVDIRSPITELSGTLVPLGEDFISAFELLREPCMARIRGGKYSSFIVSGRDGLPIEPGHLLPSPMP